LSAGWHALGSTRYSFLADVPMGASGQHISSRIPLLGFAASAAKLDLEKFVSLYPHPFLLVDIASSGGDAGVFQTAPTRDATASTTKLRKIEDTHDGESSGGAALVDQGLVCLLAKRDVNKFASMITLGRTANNDLRFEVGSVSKFHAYFTFVESTRQWLVTDASSSNGTFVNGQRLVPQTHRKLANRDTLGFGHAVTARFFETRAFHAFLRGGCKP
jgi:FHA domain